MKRCLIALLLPLLALPAAAVNKCQIAGRTVFQDAPCPAGTGGAIVVKPAAGYVDPAPAPAASGAPTETQRLQARIARMQQDSRKLLLEARLVPDAAAAVDGHRRSCDDDLAALRAQKGLAKNNLAGATWEQSLSTEMNAVALRCDTRARELTGRLEELRGECVGLGGCGAAAR